MTKILSILNHKGGTAKTTTTINLAKALNILGQRILTIDLDPQANLSQSLGVEEENETIAEVFGLKLQELPIKKLTSTFHLVPASLELSAIESSMYSNINSYFLLKSKLEVVKDNYDYILIDCPPSLGIFTQNALIASTNVLVTVQSQFLALKGLDTVYSLVNTIQDKLNKGLTVLGLIITQTNNTKLSKDIVSSLKGTFKEKVFATTIRQNVALAEASAQRMDIFSYNPESYGAVDYMNLAKEVHHE